MTDVPTADRPSDKVEILVQKQDDNTYNLRAESTQVQKLGALLRGKSKFSVVNVIIIPLIVTVATLLVTNVFQYFSWLNSVRLEKASTRATKATNLYQTVATAISERHYATLLYISAARIIANLKTSDSSELSKLIVSAHQQRINSYYDKLRSWNEQYDVLLTNIDYIFDRPIFMQKDPNDSENFVSAGDLKNVNCQLALPLAIDKIGLDKSSLKVQFAVINHCFQAVNALLDTRIDQVANNKGVIDNNFENDLEHRLSDIYTMANVFRCYSLRRIEYYYNEKEQSIVSLFHPSDWIFHWSRMRAVDHLNAENKQCAPHKSV